MTDDTQEMPRRSLARNFFLLLPLILFVILAAVFFVMLDGHDTTRVPSALIGAPAPQTDLPPLAELTRDGAPVPGLTNAAFAGKVTVVNVWASWCVPCHDEIPFLAELAKDQRIQLAGINYKDQPDNARRFLNRYGNPFALTGADERGRTAIDWGVYGVPETFIVGRDGKIAYKLIGPIGGTNFTQLVKPEIEKALAAK